MVLPWLIWQGNSLQKQYPCLLQYRLYSFWPLYQSCRFGEVEGKLFAQHWRLWLIDTFLSLSCCLEGDSTGSVDEWALLNTLYKSVPLEQGISASLPWRVKQKSELCMCVWKTKARRGSMKRGRDLPQLSSPTSMTLILALLQCLSDGHIRELCKHKISQNGL